ncbi:MAG: hypothetical protein NT004_14375 [Bacteroidetes bacterium]|nr:hypothetical protein [Bacteroidota bacterium]
MKNFYIILILLFFPALHSLSQKSYQMELLNLVQYNETEYRFDVRMKNTSADPSGAGAFAIEGIQWQLLYNTAILNGGALNNTYLTYVSSTTDLVGAAIVPQSPRFTTDQTMMQWLTSALDIGGETTLFNSGNWKRIGTFKVVLRDVSSSGSVAKNWGDGLLNLSFNSSSNIIVTECGYEVVDGACLRVGAGFTTITNKTLTNSVVNKPLFSRCFTGTGNYSDAISWNNAVAVTDPSYHNVPSSSANNISIGGYSTGGAISPGVCTLTDNRIVSDLTIKITSSLTVNPAKQLTVNGSLYVDNGSTSAITLKSTAAGTASLIHYTPGIAATAERYIAGWSDARHGWHFLSSPVAAQPISVFHTPGLGNDFYKWEETNAVAKWINRTTTEGILNPSFETNFAVGTKGYLIANSVTATTSFTGILNVASVPIPGLTNTNGTNYAGWHLLGNPFSSAIRFNQGAWNKTNIGAYSQVWNESVASYKVLAGNQEIPAMNGFMVYTTGSGSLTIPADARVHGDSVWYKADAVDERILLTANDPEGRTSQETILTFNADATEGFDLQYDSYFIAGFAPAFYSIGANHYFALNTLPELNANLNIPLGFVKNSSTEFNIRLVETIPSLTVYLRDIKLNQDQNLTKYPVYNFTATDGDDPLRFQLHFAGVGISETIKTTPDNIYGFGKTIYIVSNTGDILNGSAIVYNMMGESMITYPLGNTPVTMIKMDVGSGYYLVKVITRDRLFSGKVFIN